MRYNLFNTQSNRDFNKRALNHIRKFYFEEGREEDRIDELPEDFATA